MTIFIIIFFFITGEYCGSGPMVKAYSTSITSNDRLLSYVNLVLGMKISYPPDFNIQETTGNSVFIVGPLMRKDVIVELHLYRNVSFTQIVSADNPRNFMYHPQLIGTDKTVSINGSKFIFKGHPAYRYDYVAFEHNFGPVIVLEKVRVTEVIVSDDNNIYSFYFSAPLATYSKYLPIVIAMLDSFEIMNQAEPIIYPPGLSSKGEEQSGHIYPAETSLDTSIPSSILANRTQLNITIGIVKPTFTAAAYNNAFYNFYDLFKSVKVFAPIYRNLSLLTGKIPQSTDSYIASFKNHTQFGAYDILKINGHIKKLLPQANITVISDSDADADNVLRKSFNILILGHQEYVTQQEYNNLKEFVKDGGILICLDGNLFYAEVKYDKSAQTVTLVSGHYHNFNGKYAWIGPPDERWAQETSQWLGSNYYSDRGPGNRLSFINNPFGYIFHEEQYISNPSSEILFNYDDIRGIPSPPTIATYQKSYGLGKVIVFGIYSDIIIANPDFQVFFDKLLFKYAIPAANLRLR